MIILDHAQGTEEWFSSRVAIPTASKFDKVVTSQGKRSDQRTKYMYQLAGESLSGRKEDTYQSPKMYEGLEREPEARDYYELVTGADVKVTGLILSDCRRYGCSPDGLMLGKGLEIKCPSLAVHTEYLDKRKLPTKYYQQVHGSMLVTGFETWDFLSYYPGIKPLLITVERNNEFCAKLEAELIKFYGELQELIARLKSE